MFLRCQSHRPILALDKETCVMMLKMNLMSLIKREIWWGLIVAQLTPQAPKDELELCYTMNVSKSVV